MYIQSSIAFAVLGLAAKAVVAATPPACLLAALNSMPDASDVSKLCGDGASKVNEAILKDCGNTVESAYAYFEETCTSKGKTLSVSSSSTSSARSSTAAGSATLGSGYAMPTGAHGTGTVGGHYTIKTTAGGAAPTGVVPTPGKNGTVSTNGLSGSSSSPPAATTTAFTGGAARSVAGSFAGVAIVAAGLVIAL